MVGAFDCGVIGVGGGESARASTGFGQKEGGGDGVLEAVEDATSKETVEAGGDYTVGVGQLGGAVRAGDIGSFRGRAYKEEIEGGACTDFLALASRKMYDLVVAYVYACFMKIDELTMNGVYRLIKNDEFRLESNLKASYKIQTVH